MFESEAIFADLLGRAAACLGRAVSAGSPRSRRARRADAVARATASAARSRPIASACASATLALGNALDALRAGEIDIGARRRQRFALPADLSPASTRCAPSTPVACRPVPRRARRDVDRRGRRGPGARDRGSAPRRRGARPLGWLAGAGASCDAHHMTAPDPQGDGHRARGRARRSPTRASKRPTIDFVNVHGTGTPHNDAAEAHMLREMFGDRAAGPAGDLVEGRHRALPRRRGRDRGGRDAALSRARRWCTRRRARAAVDPALGLDLVVGEAARAPPARAALCRRISPSAAPTPRSSWIRAG